VGLTATTTHDGFPSIVRLANDDLLVHYRQASSHAATDGIMRSVRSTDDGATWGSPTTVYAPPGLGVSGGQLTRLADDTVLCVFQSGDGIDPAKSYAMVSTDATATAWGTPVEITYSFTGFAMAESPATELPNGDLVVPAYGELSGDTYWSIRMSRSTDGGATWADDGQLFAGDDLGFHISEPVLLVLDDGTWLLTIRSDGSTEFIWQSRSFDDGATWEPMSIIIERATGRPSTIQRADGAVLCAYRTEAGDDPRFRTSWDRGGSWTGTDGDYSNGATLFWAYGGWATLASGQVVTAYSLEQAGATDADLWFAKVAT
jgi:hypothetical protein